MNASVSGNLEITVTQDKRSSFVMEAVDGYFKASRMARSVVCGASVTYTGSTRIDDDSIVYRFVVQGG